jgi:hypothetical protein
MEDSTIVLIISFIIIGLITAFCIWIVVKDKRYFKKMHSDLVQRFDAVADALGLVWVVPIDHVREKKSPPALTGKLKGRDLYVALQDDSDDESLRAKWDLVVHVGLRKTLVPKKARKVTLKGLKKSRRGQAFIKQRTLLVHRSGLHLSADEIVTLVQQCVTGAGLLEGREA